MHRFKNIIDANLRAYNSIVRLNYVRVSEHGGRISTDEELS